MWYSYAIVRVVPRVERGETLNVGIVLLSRTSGFLQAAIELDAERLRQLHPGTDVATLQRHLANFVAIASGDPAGGPMAELPPSERFHWLTAPRSTSIQTSPVHIGTSPHPEQELETLLDRYVR